MTDQPLSTGEIIKRMVEIRDEKRKINERLKGLNEQWRSHELELLIRLDEQEQDAASTKFGTASINETILPQVVDWDAFNAHILETEALYLLQRRPAAAAYRELLDSGETVPGVEPYTQRAIGLRKK